MGGMMRYTVEGTVCGKGFGIGLFEDDYHGMTKLSRDREPGI